MLGRHASLVFFLAIAGPGFGQNFDWVTVFPSSEQATGRAIAQSPNGRIFTAGEFSQNITVGDSEYVSAGSRDIYVACLNDTGVVLWSEQISGTGMDRVWSLAADNNAVYLYGTFSNQCSVADSLIVGSGNMDILIVKFTPNGELAWVRTAGWIGNDEARTLALAQDGTLRMNGTYLYDARFGDFILPYAVENDFFVAAMDSEGNWQWVSTLSGWSSFRPQDLVTLDDGSCLTATWLYGPTVIGGDSVWVGPDPVNQLIHVSPSGILTADSTLPADWNFNLLRIAKRSDGGLFVAEVFSSGYQPTGIDLPDTCSRDILLLSRSPTGQWEWAKVIGNTGAEKDLSLFAVSNIHAAVLGAYSGSLNYADQTLECTDYADIYFTRFGAQEDPLQWYSCGGQQAQWMNTAVMDSEGEFLLVGHFLYTAVLPPFELEHSDGWSAYVAHTAKPEVGIAPERSSKNEACKAYPNPTTSFTALSGIGPGAQELSIVDQLGRLVHERHSYRELAPIDLRVLENGSYFIKTKTCTFRVIKE
ncbi:MAG: T9SS type A sorting domain-containing protein [Flavobacteriales bacterium]|nr:T9SS type A sorting domain-containing protein [Flavobacteriales bacterium]